MRFSFSFPGGDGIKMINASKRIEESPGGLISAPSGTSSYNFFRKVRLLSLGEFRVDTIPIISLLHPNWTITASCFLQTRIDLNREASGYEPDGSTKKDQDILRLCFMIEVEALLPIYIPLGTCRYGKNIKNTTAKIFLVSILV